MNHELPPIVQKNIDTLIQLAGKDNQFLHALIRSTVENAYGHGMKAGLDQAIETVRDRTLR